MPGTQVHPNVAKTYRVAVDDVIARERAELGLPVANSLRAWCGPQETLIAAASEADAWKKACDRFPPTAGYRVESVLLVKTGVPGSGRA